MSKKSLILFVSILILSIIPATTADDPSGAMFGMMTDMHSEFVDIVKVGNPYPGPNGRPARANQCQMGALALTNNIISAQFGQEQIMGLLDTYFDFLKDPTALEDQAKELGKTVLQHVWDKINEGDNEELEYEPGFWRGDPELRACNAKLNVVWDKQAKQIRIKVTGDCECKYRNMRDFEVDIVRDVVLRKDRSGNFNMEAVTKSMNVRANCDCRQQNVTETSWIDRAADFIVGLWDGITGGSEEPPVDETEKPTERTETPTTGGTQTPPKEDYPDPQEGSTRDEPLPPTEEITPPKKEEPPRTDCPQCKQIESQIEDAINKKYNAELELSKLKEKLPDLTDKKRRIEQAIDGLEKDKDALENPQSWAESEGRRVTNIDLRLQREASRELWNQYLNGEMTAQQLEDAWKKLDEEGANKDLLDKAKKEIDAEIKKAKDDLSAANNEIDALNDNIDRKKNEISGLEDEIEKLKSQLEDCKKRCAAGVLEEPQIAVGTGGTANTSAPSCPSGTYSDSSCSNGCKSTEKCEWYTTLNSGRQCYACTEEQCPRGTTEGGCSGTCDSCDKTVLDNGKECFQCKNYQCSSNSWKTESECKSNCPSYYSGCSVSAQTGDSKCWSCSQLDCTRWCESQGFVIYASDSWHQYITDYLNQNGNCKKNAEISMSTVSLGECKCAKQPRISISGDLVCAGTPCGDVPCGSSTSCQQGDRTVSVSCSWSGWQWQGGQNYVPVIGVS